MQRAFVESMKTIAQTAIEKAGFDKTRNGKIVGVNSITNTYSVRVDGIVYNNVKVVNDMTCNVGDTVKVNIPMNNPSQAYITSSILSDESIGQKIAQATTAIDDINNQIESIAEIANSIYQLSVDVSYANDGNYKNVTYTAMLMQDGVNVTEDHEASEFRWYLEKTTGTEELSGSPAWAVVLSTRDYFYGQSILLEWTYTYTDVISGEQKTTKLRSRVTLISNDAIQQVAKYTTEVTNGGVFVHRADGNYDVGADWESTWAYGVKIANTVDIIKGGKIYGSFGGDYLTVGNTSENNIYMDASSFIQLRKGSTVLTDIRPGSITLGNTSAGYYYTYIDSSNVKFRRNVNGTIRDIATFNSSGITLKNDNGINLMSLTSGGLNLYNGNSSNNVNLASFSNGAITMRNSSNIVTFQTTTSGMYLYSGNANNNINIASFTTSGITLRNANGQTLMSAGSNAFNLYYYSSNLSSNINVMSVGSGGMTLRNIENKRTAYFSGDTIRLGETNSNATIYMNANNFYMTAGTSNPQSDSGIFYWIGCDNTGYTGTNQIKQTAISTIRQAQISGGSYPSKYAEVGTYIMNGYHYGFLNAMGSGSIGSQVSVGSDGYTYIGGNKEVWVETTDSGKFVVTLTGDNSSSEMIKVAYNSSANSGNKRRLYFPHSYSNDLNSGRSVKITDTGLVNTNSSSRKYKHDITYVIKEELNPQKLYNLKIAQFKYNEDHIVGYNRGRDLIGIIAEDIDEVYHLGAYHESNGSPEDWDERILIPAMLKLIQEQHEEIEKIKLQLEHKE